MGPPHLQVGVLSDSCSPLGAAVPFFPRTGIQCGFVSWSAPQGGAAWALVLPPLWTVCVAELVLVASSLCGLVSPPVLGKITGSRDQMKCAQA